MSSVPHVTHKAGVILTPWTDVSSVLHTAITLASGTCGWPIVITCGTEGHGPTDPHTRGAARDIHTLDWTPLQILQTVAALQLALHQVVPGIRFTVLYESAARPVDSQLAAMYYANPGASAPHIHVQLAIGEVYPPVG